MLKINDIKIGDQKIGWPWTEESNFLTKLRPDGSDWPRITIVTPSYNQGRFIEETIRSILLQNYPNLEYIIIDGGSEDNTLDIIKKYEPWLSYWISEPDMGQSDAINKGFQMSTGLYGNWINSDDLLEKNALWSLAQSIDTTQDKLVFLGDYKLVGENGEYKAVTRSYIRKIEELVDIENHWRNGKENQIGQQATFFPIKLFKDVGMLDINNHYTMDYDLWGRYLLAGATFVPISDVLGTFRIYSGQKISFRNKMTKNLINSAFYLINSCVEWDIAKKRYYKRLLFSYSLKYYYRNIRSIIGVRRRIKYLTNLIHIR